MNSGHKMTTDSDVTGYTLYETVVFSRLNDKSDKISFEAMYFTAFKTTTTSAECEPVDMSAGDH